MSNLLVQNIKHTNNTTSMTVDSSGQVSVRGEGSATTTNLQQGIAKQWTQIKMNDTWALNDSFNCSSAEDSGTGYSKVNFTNNFSNVHYSSTNAGDSSDWGHVICTDGPVTTSHLWIYGLRSQAQASADNPRAQNTVHGDLA
tara:strand:+ start:159 stop:584 length:426 start_codon:yes stop_codon:yes gene_type:complete